MDILYLENKFIKLSHPEYGGGVGDDCVDPGELLEQHQHQGQYERRSILSVYNTMYNVQLAITRGNLNDW